LGGQTWLGGVGGPICHFPVGQRQKNSKFSWANFPFKGGDVGGDGKGRHSGAVTLAKREELHAFRGSVQVGGGFKKKAPRFEKEIVLPPAAGRGRRGHRVRGNSRMLVLVEGNLRCVVVEIGDSAREGRGRGPFCSRLLRFAFQRARRGGLETLPNVKDTPREHGRHKGGLLGK